MSTLRQALQHKIDLKTKPLGALGRLESLAMQIGERLGSESPELRNPTMLVFAADHGAAKEGLSAYPQEVTYQMVYNFLSGGAAINVFCRQHGIALKVVDAGVNHDFGQQHPDLLHAKVGYGTASYLKQAAMTPEQLQACLSHGAAHIDALQDCNVVGFGEMGIGNTSSASLLMSAICHLPIAQCIGKGTGLDDAGMSRKRLLLESARLRHSQELSPLEALRTFGGFEIAQMCGAMLRAQEKGMLLLIDGFIATSAFMVAHALQPEIMQGAVFCHQSDEHGHVLMLSYLRVKPLLSLGLRLGEGTGCALAYPLLQSAVAFLHEMSSFEQAQVSNKS